MTATRWRGHVVNADGAPVARARVTIVAATVPVPEIALLTGADGGFELDLPDGRFRLRAHAAGEIGEVEVAVEGGAGGGELVIGTSRDA